MTLWQDQETSTIPETLVDGASKLDVIFAVITSVYYRWKQNLLRSVILGITRIRGRNACHIPKGEEAGRSFIDFGTWALNIKYPECEEIETKKKLSSTKFNFLGANYTATDKNKPNKHKRVS